MLRPFQQQQVRRLVLVLELVLSGPDPVQFGPPSGLASDWYLTSGCLVQVRSWSSCCPSRKLHRTAPMNQIQALDVELQLCTDVVGDGTQEEIVPS